MLIVFSGVHHGAAPLTVGDDGDLEGLPDRDALVFRLVGGHPLRAARGRRRGGKFDRTDRICVQANKPRARVERGALSVLYQN